MFFFRSDMASITVSLDGEPVPSAAYEWATCEGGALEADDQKTRPGGMARQVAIGGPTSRGDITVTTQFTDLIANSAKILEERSGRGVLTVSVTFKDPNGTSTAHKFTRKGIIKSVQIPDIDVNSGDVGFLTVIGSMDEAAT